MSKDKIYLSESLKGRIDLSGDIFQSNTVVQLSLGENIIPAVELLATQFVFCSLRDKSRNKKLRSIEFSADVSSIQKIIQCNNDISIMIRQGENVVLHEVMLIETQQIIVDVGEIINDRVIIRIYSET
jgi:hypothetical protein